MGVVWWGFSGSLVGVVWWGWFGGGLVGEV